MSKLAYLCVRCEGCEQPLPFARIARIGTLPYCTSCHAVERAWKRRTLDCCGHPANEHNAFGCMVEIEDGTAFCPCPPPPLANQP